MTFPGGFPNHIMMQCWFVLSFASLSLAGPLAQSCTGLGSHCALHFRLSGHDEF
ncbi:hypothetical protein M758_12G079500 [Ceratodon purpureus]|nr:hypothetical protein M758_12G079500 [Ceratodon purpureus]